ncbi:MAG: hypothetical protein R3B98_03935 [Hyphomonas sp.]
MQLTRGSVAVAALALLAGCGTIKPVGSNGSGLLGGEKADLRILMTPCSLERTTGAGTIALKFASGLLKDAGTASLKAFGDYLEEASKEKTTRSVAMQSGVFYRISTNEAGEAEYALNPNAQCIHIIRAGHGTAGPIRPPTDDVERQWERLNLLETPNLYARFRIETAIEVIDQENSQNVVSKLQAEEVALEDLEETDSDGTEAADAPAAADAPEMPGGRMLNRTTMADSAPVKAAPPPGSDQVRPDLGQRFTLPAQVPPYFRLRLEDLYVDEFQSPGTTGTRDFAVVFNFGSASAPGVFDANGASAGVGANNYFALGGIRIAGLHQGYHGGKGVTGLVSGWMSLPGIEAYNEYGLFNLTAYTVETSPGNPVMESIGKYLSDHSGEAGDAIEEIIDPTGAKRRDRIEEKYERIRNDRAALRKLDGKNEILRDALASPFRTPNSVSDALDGVDDELLNVLERRDKNGGLVADGAAETLRDSEALMEEARAWLKAQAAAGEAGGGTP